MGLSNIQEKLEKLDTLILLEAFLKEKEVGEKLWKNYTQGDLTQNFPDLQIHYQIWTDKLKFWKVRTIFSKICSLESGTQKLTINYYLPLTTTALC